jgi:hypothetical protein
MPVSNADIKRLRRIVNELDDTTYKDEDLAVYLASYPLVDKNGRTIDDGDNWAEEYDLHGAAADIWEEKAAVLASKHDFSADGASFSANQMYQSAMAQAKHHRASQRAQAKEMPRRRSINTYFPDYPNPIFDEDENPDWIDSVV